MPESSTKIVITGASGFLGRKLFDIFGEKYKVFGTAFSSKSPDLIPLDITKKESVEKLFEEIKPDVVIHAAALSEPRFCEEHPKEAREVNDIGTKNVAAAAAAHGTKIFYISTSYVFDGEKNEPYSEADSPNPGNVYAKTKLMGEGEVAQIKKSVILRCDKMYGYNGVGRDNDLIGKILDGKELGSDTTRTFSPLFVDDVARAILFLLNRDAEGVFHLSGKDAMLKIVFFRKLASLFGREDLVKELPTDDVVVSRPKNGSLSSKKIESLGFEFTEFETALKELASIFA